MYKVFLCKGFRLFFTGNDPAVEQMGNDAFPVFEIQIIKEKGDNFNKGIGLLQAQMPDKFCGNQK